MLTWGEIGKLLDQKQYTLALRLSVQHASLFDNIPDYRDEEAYETLARLNKLIAYVNAYQEER